MALTGDSTSLVDADGNSAIELDFGIERTDVSEVLATDEGQRHTRRVMEVAPRVYRGRLRNATPGEIDRLRTVLVAAKGGVVPVPWRHPQDDAPGIAATAPLYRITNAIEAGIEIDRARSGLDADVTLKLESLADLVQATPEAEAAVDELPGEDKVPTEPPIAELPGITIEIEPGTGTVLVPGVNIPSGSYSHAGKRPATASS